MLALINFNASFAQSRLSTDTVKESLLDSVFIKTKAVAAHDLFLRYTKENIDQHANDTCFVYRVQFRMLADSNGTKRLTDSISGIFYIGFRKNTYQAFSSLAFGPLERAASCQTTPGRDFDLNLLTVFNNNPYSNRNSLRLEQTIKGDNIRLVRDSVKKAFYCLNKWKYRQGYEHVMYPYLSAIYYFDKLNRIDSITSYHIYNYAGQQDFSDTTLFKGRITYVFSNDNARYIKQAFCLVTEVRKDTPIYTVELNIDLDTSVQKHFRFALDKEGKRISKFKTIPVALTQFSTEETSDVLKLD